jgi:hypothetical protein
MTVQGTVANLNTALNGLTYTPPSGLTNNSSDTLNLVTNDLGNSGSGGPLTASNTVGITINHVDLAPANSAPATASTLENTALVFSSSNGNAISISDADANGGQERVTLTATNGTLTLNGTSGLTFSTGTGTNDASMVFTGTIANINSALNGLTYTPTPNFFGAASVQITTNDQGNTGSGGPQSASNTVNITVVEVNQAPGVNVPGSQVSVNTNIVFSAANGNQVSVTDVDAGSNPVQITLTASSGTITLASTSGLTFSTGSGAGDGTMVFTGTVANVNAALNGMSFHPTAYGSSLQVTINDLGNSGVGGAKSGTNGPASPAATTSGPVSSQPGPGITPVPSPALNSDVEPGSRRPLTLVSFAGLQPVSSFQMPNLGRLREPIAENQALPEAEIMRAEKLRPKAASATSVAKPPAALDYDSLWAQADTIAKEFDGRSESSSLTIGMTAGASVVLSTGYVVWMLRAGTLLASVLSSLPAWQSFDPLPVLDYWERKKDRDPTKPDGADDSDDEDEPLKNLMT